VRAQQLMNDVEALALGGVLPIQGVAILQLLGWSHVRIVIDDVHLLRQVGKNEFVVGIRRHEVDA
jgi:hypothetical protein